MTHQLITLDPLARVRAPIGGFPPRREIAPGQAFRAPEGHAYVPVLPAEEYDPETHVLERNLTADADGWIVRELTPEEIESRLPKPPSEVGAGQIHAAMILMDLAADETALDSLIVGIINTAPLTPKEKAIARVLWKRATVFRRDHPFVALVQAALNKDDAFMDQLFSTAESF
jgi:hypothetical protein